MAFDSHNNIAFPYLGPIRYLPIKLIVFTKIDKYELEGRYKYGSGGGFETS